VQVVVEFKIGDGTGLRQDKSLEADDEATAERPLAYIYAA